MTDVVPTEISPEIEAKSAFPLFTIETPERASPENVKKIKALNNAFATLHVLGLWQKNIEQLETFDSLALSQQSLRMNDLWRESRDFYRQSENLGKQIEEIGERIVGAKKGELFTQRKSLKVENPESLALLAAKLPQIYHDVGNSFNYIIGFISLEDPELLTEHLPKASSNLRSTLEAKSKLIEDEYPKETLPAIKLRGEVEFTSFLLEVNGIKPEFEETLPPVEVVWSKAWFITLLENVFQNTKKVYKDKEQALNTELGPEEKILKVNFQTTQESGRDYLDVVFEDRGLGYTPEILEKGFQKGYSSWQTKGVEGTGIGMEAQSQALKVYGGKLIPENVTDQEGKTIGARLTVRLPVHH